MDLVQKLKKQGLAELKEKLGLKNVHQVPQIDKVIVAIGIGSLATRKSQKDFSEIQDNLTKITGQVPRLITAKKAVSNFKLRAGMPVMLQVTLRNSKAYDFLWRLTTLVLPRVRDFSGLNAKSFDKDANLNIGLKSYNIFPELAIDDVAIPVGLQITVVTTTNEKEHAKELMKYLGFIFKE